MRFQKVYLEITNICNRNCAFCPGTQREKSMMSLSDFRRLAVQLRGWTEYLYFHLMGEPLLHPQLAEFLQIAAELGFRVILTTNGTLLSETQQILLSAEALHKVNISIHSFEANDCGCLEDYLKDCISFACAAAQKGVIVSFRLWNNDGAQTVGMHDRNPEILSFLQKTFPLPWQTNARGSRLAEHIYLNQDVVFDWPAPTAEDTGSDVFCYGLKDHIGILCDGTVVPCCLDSDGNLPLGNLLQQPLEEILDSSRAKSMYEGFRQRYAAESLCRRCGYARRFGKH